jgi:hypothetical protein
MTCTPQIAAEQCHHKSIFTATPILHVWNARVTVLRLNTARHWPDLARAERSKPWHDVDGGAIVGDGASNKSIGRSGRYALPGL